MALISGAASVIDDFEARSQTRVHSSPPAAVVIRAAQHALEVNQERGDATRLRLARLVIQFAVGSQTQTCTQPGACSRYRPSAPFPASTWPGCTLDCFELGVRTVLGQGRHGGTARIRFVINARHCGQDIDRAVDVLTVVVDRFSARVITSGA